MSYHYITFR